MKKIKASLLSRIEQNESDSEAALQMHREENDTLRMDKENVERELAQSILLLHSAKERFEGELAEIRGKLEVSLTTYHLSFNAFFHLGIRGIEIGPPHLA